MRVYDALSEETLRSRKLIVEWADDGLLSETQSERLEQETISNLRTTNIFLRMILFLFTLICVGAVTALFFKLFVSRASDQDSGVYLLIFAALCYAGAEIAASRGRLYRYGIEEALAACSVGFLCVGLQLALFSRRPYSPRPDAVQALVPGIGAVFSLWIWRRFGHWYGFLAAMIFVAFLPGYWTASHWAQHVMVAGFYAAGLLVITAVRTRHRFDYLDDEYSLVEALLWVGMYIAINLKISSMDLRLPLFGVVAPLVSEFPRSFYWTTWMLIWCLPPVVLVRGIRQKDRFVMAAGAIVAILTFVSNKPYLGWPRHTWDPMLLGILLTGVSLFIRRWLARGPGGVRRGFTAARLSGKEKKWMDAGSVVMGLATPQSITPQTQNAEFRFGGGSTGGGGAGGEF